VAERAVTQLTTSEVGPDEPLTGRQAAELTAMSYKSMHVLVRRGEVPAHRDGREWVLYRSELEAWIRSRQVEEGDIGPTLPGRARRSNVHLLEAALALPEWDVERVAERLGVKADKVARWRETGVPNRYVKVLRELDPLDRCGRPG
jgi:excisionase family DNA binding protein